MERNKTIVLKIFVYEYNRYMSKLSRLDELSSGQERAVYSVSDKFAYILGYQKLGGNFPNSSMPLPHSYIADDVVEFVEGRKELTDEQLQAIINVLFDDARSSLDAITERDIRKIGRVCSKYRRKNNILHERLGGKGYFGINSNEETDHWSYNTYKFLELRGYDLPPTAIFKSIFAFAYQLGKQAARTTNE